jgi:hypothetical protein
MLNLGLDPSQDTPIELLHTILLGLVKYAWFMSTLSMTKKQRDELAIDLESLSIDGLSMDPLQAAYMIQYRASLIGRQYKQIVQTIIFHIHKYVSDDYLQLWKSVGRLSALLWFPEIKDLPAYQVRCDAPGARPALADILSDKASGCNQQHT